MKQNILYTSILLLGLASYASGLTQMWQGKYAPSVFSRAVWLILAIISFAGVVASNGSGASTLLAGIFLAGNSAICLLSFWKGSKDFGRLEFLCLGLLGISLLIWWLFNAPLVSLVISLLAHFIGALPTYKRVLLNPESESTLFWFFFFAANVLGVFASTGSSLSAIVFPVYFTLFDGSLFMLSMRKQSSAHSK